jgi:hypothetical protein
MNIDLTNRVYKVDDKVYKGYTPLTVQNQRGRLFIKYRGKQVNIKDIPVLPEVKNDWCCDYIFGGLSVRYPCPAIDYFIHRHRLGNRISAQDYKEKFKIS